MEELKTLKELYNHEDLNFDYWGAYMDFKNKMDDSHRIMKLIKAINHINATLENARKRAF